MPIIQQTAAKTYSLRFFAISLMAMMTVVMTLSGCAGSSDPTVKLLGKTMGTTYSIKYLPGSKKLDSVDVQARVETELATVNQQMSTYISTSEVSKFNQASSTDWIEVSTETAEVVALAQEISELTAGAFDVTVGPLVDLWGFGPTQRSEQEPSDEQVQSVRAITGFQKLHVRTTPPSLRKDVPELRIDLSAIAKGHGVDRVADVLAELGIENYFVEIGGEVSARGFRGDGIPWQVGIERPEELALSLQAVVGLTGKSMATSGDYRNYYEIDGKRFSHTIDAATGRPVDHQLASASVIADNCALADALATSMMALGPTRAQALAEQQDWTVLLITRSNEEFQSITTLDFAKYFTSDPDSANLPNANLR